MRLFRQTVLTLLCAAPALTAAAQTAPATKLDESLREALERGCVDTKSVIITAAPGFRQSLRDSLAAHGDTVRGEFPNLNAVAAEVHCADLTTLANFGATSALSADAPVGVQQLSGLLSSLSYDQAQANITAARTALDAAKATASTRQLEYQNAEKAATAANATAVAIICHRLGSADGS